MTPDEIERLDREVEAAALAIELTELRRTRRLTQEELARRMGTRQGSISKLERRRDVRLSTLREVVAAMGGELHIIAHFPDGDFRIEMPPLAAEAAD